MTAPDTAAPSVCEHPITLARPGFDSTTGEVLPDTEIQVDCGTRFSNQCKHCSAVYAKRSHLAIASCLPDPSERAHVLFLTLTAPSFGKVHTYAIQHRKKQRKNRNKNCIRRCACNEYHFQNQPGVRSIIGSPVDPDTYDYKGQIAFNRVSGKLYQNFTRKLKHTFTDVDVKYVKVAEPQHRGAVHFHIIFIFRPDEETGYLPPLKQLKKRLLAICPEPPLTPAQVAKRTAKGKSTDHRIGVTTNDPYTSRRYSFGHQLKLLELTPKRMYDTGETSWAPVASYLAKYLTKSAGGQTAYDQIPNNSPAHAHLEQLEAHSLEQATALQLTKHDDQTPLVAVFKSRVLVRHHKHDLDSLIKRDLPDTRRGDLTRAVRGFGFRGQPRSASRGYGLSLKQLKEQARLYRLNELGIPANRVDTNPFQWRFIPADLAAHAPPEPVGQLTLV